MAPASSQQQQPFGNSEWFNGPEFPEGSSTERETSMNEIQWVPGFIQLTSGRGLKYWQCVAQIVQFHSGTRGDTHGSYIILRLEDEGDRFVLETPDQIGELIRQEWEHRINRDAEIRWAATRGERL